MTNEIRPGIDLKFLTPKELQSLLAIIERHTTHPLSPIAQRSFNSVTIIKKEIESRPKPRSPKSQMTFGFNTKSWVVMKEREKANFTANFPEFFSTLQAECTKRDIPLDTLFFESIDPGDEDVVATYYPSSPDKTLEAIWDLKAQKIISIEYEDNHN